MEKKERLFYLDFIRALAMIIIVAFHFFCHFETFNITAFNPLLYKFINIDFGVVGVTIFFIISGVSLMYNYSEKIEYKTYAKKRFLNIYPMFWIAYTFLFLNDFIINQSINNTIPKSKLILSFLGIDGYFLYLGPNFYKIGEWFLGAIIFIYILFPLYRLLIKKDKKVAIITLIIHFILSIYILQYNPFIIQANRNLIVCITSFLIGIYFIEYVKEIKWYHALTAFILFIITIMVKTSISEYLVSIVSGVLLFVVLVYVSKFIKNNVIHNLFNFLSKYSYAIFLVHHILIIKVESKFSNQILGKFETLCLFTYTFLIIIVMAIILSNISKKVIKALLDDKNKKGEKTCQNLKELIHQ